MQLNTVSFAVYQCSILKRNSFPLMFATKLEIIVTNIKNRKTKTQKLNINCFLCVIIIQIVELFCV